MSVKRIVFKYSPRHGRVIEVGGSDDIDERQERAHLHFVQDDTIPPTVSHATDEGLVFTSKSALRAHYRQYGFEDTGGSHLQGVGAFDRRHKANREEIRADVQESLRQLKWGEVPVSEKEREVCLREERTYQEFKRRQSR